jgi:uncharacterized protein
MTKVVVTGATGVIGRAVVAALNQRGDQVAVLSRDPGQAGEQLQVQAHGWPEPTSRPPPAAALGGADAVVNLMGEPIAQRWTAQAKERIRDSRVLGTRNLVAGIRAVAPDARPGVLVSGSATGFYGPLSDQPVDESARAGTDWLADLVRRWETEALAAEHEQLRVVLTRTGVVLSPSGGALAKMLPPFRLGIGGPVASGRQYLPWIHLDDVVGAIIHCLDDASARGPVNLTAPGPVDNRAFSRALGHALHRPALLPVPAFALQLLYGEMAEIVTTGQRAIPERLRALGYQFQFADLDAALRDVLSR